MKKTKKDLTEAEQSLVTANDKLTEANHNLLAMNNESIEVVKDLAMANEHIKQQALKQKEFIDIAAHELRTPTQSILGYTEMIMSEPKTNVEYVKVIARNANRIQKLISNILDMARIDSLNLQVSKEQFSLSALISTIVQDFKKQIQGNKKRNLDLIYDNITAAAGNPTEEDNNKDVIIEADKDRIAQVIINLVDNAITNTDSGKIVITTTTINPSHIENKKNHNHRKEIIVKVKDSGKGLDPKMFSKVFSKFFTASGLGGTGLGLYICKAIVEAHNGSIWAENNKDEKGATFSFSLPLK